MGKPVVVRKRKQRSRPTPKWLLQKQELDEIAKRRTLMVLDVLSGQLPVTEAIARAQISRGHYYQLEERALKAVLEAMEPGASPGRPPETTTRLLQLDERVRQLEAEKRRLERLLQLTRKALRPGPMKTTLGRPRLEGVGRRGSPASARTTQSSHGPASPTSSSDPSTR
jgi:hypothetical protein